MTPTARTRKPDAVLAAAVDEARAALLVEVTQDQVGDYQDFVVEGERALTHFFRATVPGYRGWRWSVTVTRASRHRRVTVNEIVLLPGTEALLAPDWLPWRERIQPGDLGPGDLLPAAEDDPRLVPGYLAGDTEAGDTEAGDTAAAGQQQREDPAAVRAVGEELAFGRPRVLSLEGRDEAADRWHAGSHGPHTPVAQSAPGRCATCGFMVKLSGALGTVFGVCANGYASDDGRVVSFDHGCGAHSEVRVGKSVQPQPLPAPVFDTIGYDDLETF